MECFTFCNGEVRKKLRNLNGNRYNMVSFIKADEYALISALI